MSWDIQESVLEDASPDNWMKLMIVRVQGMDKTSPLQQLRQEGENCRKKPHEHWAKGIGNKNINLKTEEATNKRSNRI